MIVKEVRKHGVAMSFAGSSFGNSTMRKSAAGGESSEAFQGSPSAAWLCPSCSVEVDAVQQYCTVCLRARPLSRKGTPQIFSGMRVHFNGIIPRTLKHPSHSVEWRMAERHGAVCEMVFDPATTNLLIYRPGYERSDKVRLCVERYHNIHCIPISWLLDSLLQSRQIHPVLYRLQSVPSVALPTVRGPVLPHHQHPFYVMHAEEYALGPLPNTNGGAALQRQKSAAAMMAQDASAIVPADLITTPEPVWQSVSIWDAASDALQRAQFSDAEQRDDDDEEEATSVRRTHGSSSGAAGRNGGLECFVHLLRNNRLNRSLFQGFVFVLSPALRQGETHDAIVRILQALGAAVADPSSTADVASLLVFATHVLYHNDDKKDPLMVEACQASVTTNPNIQMATTAWIEDCMMLDEAIPITDVYGPSSKLRSTLLKKYERRAAAQVPTPTAADGSTTPSAA